MPLGTLDAAPPPFFRQGPSALSKLIFCTTLALLLIVADVRFGLVQPLRATIATLLYPVQWMLLQPVKLSQAGTAYFVSLRASQVSAANAQYRLGLQSQRAQLVEQLSLENTRLRQLLGLRDRLNAPALAAQVLYDAADPFSRKIVISKGAIDAVLAGAPVLDELGVLGQVTRVYPMQSEVTLITDRDLAIPVLNVRNGVRGLAFGNSGDLPGTLELRFMDANVDLQVGDLLTTSGVDGTYPAGLAVARVSKIERRTSSAFARITCTALAQVAAALHVLVLQPVLLAPAPALAAKPNPKRGKP